MPVATRQSIANRASEITGISRNDAYLLVNAVVQAMRESALRGESIQLRGFGTLRIVKVKKCLLPLGSNPNYKNLYRPGDWVEVPERTKIKFKVATTFRNLVAQVK